MISHCEKEGKFFACFIQFIFIFILKKVKRDEHPGPCKAKREAHLFLLSGACMIGPQQVRGLQMGPFLFLHCFQGSHLVVPANVGLVVWSRGGSKWLDWNDDTCLSISVMWGPFLSQLTRGSFYIYIYIYTGPLPSDQSDDGICFVTPHRKWTK